jgi:periplasmic mercuric ion binding protein
LSKRSCATGIALALLALSGAAFGATRTVTLSVPSMTCSTCPITVKKALQRVQGVEKVAVTYEPKEAMITFDDTKTNTDQLRAATANAGYPSALKTDR